MAVKVLLLDIEIRPITAHVWGLYDQNIGLNQIVRDWEIISWCAKWLDSDKIFYADVRGRANKINADKAILTELWRLLDDADIVVHQNGKKFDIPKINARFKINKIKKGRPPSDYRQIDLLQINRRAFGFTSNKLEYISNILNQKYKKQKHNEFAGHDLWMECCERDNIKAWKSMEKYNRYDVLSLEESYKEIRAWDNSINFNVYEDKIHNTCGCGSSKIRNDGFSYSNSGKFQRFRCKECGKRWVSKRNLLSNEKRRTMLK